MSWDKVAIGWVVIKTSSWPIDTDNPLFVHMSWHESTWNSTTTTPLAWWATFTWVWENIIDEWVILVAVFSDVASATDWLSVEFSTDWTNWDHTDNFTIAANTWKTFSFQPAAMFYRVLYTNWAAAQSVFRLQTLLKTSYIKPSSHRISDAISWEDDAELTKAVLTWLSPNGLFVNVKTSVAWELATKLSSPLTAFWDIRVAEMKPQFQGSFEYTVDNTDLNENTVTWWWTVTQGSAMLNLNTSTTTWSYAEFRSRRAAKYKPWLWGLMRFTACFTAWVAATSQLIWLADELWSSEDFENGYMVWYTWADFTVAKFRNDTVSTVTQMNFDDPLDWTGRSWLSIDFEKLNVFQIQFQYLWAWAIKFFVESPDTWDFTLFHTIKYAGTETQPSVHNPNFHFCWYADNKATTANLTLKSASYGYFVEWPTQYIENHQPQNWTGQITKTWVTTSEPILTIRNKTTYASKQNFIEILAELISGSIEASSPNNLWDLAIIVNWTLWGTPSWSDINTNNSVVEIDTSATSISWWKALLDLPLAWKNDRAFVDLNPFKIILEEWETISVVWSSAASATINASLTWKELF